MATIVLAIVLGAGGFYILSANKQTSQLPVHSTKPVSSPISTPDPTAEWKMYTNNEIGFQFKYPPDTQFSTSDAETRIHVTVGKLNIVCGYGQNFTIIFKGNDLVKHNDFPTYPILIAGRDAEKYDKTDNLEGCKNSTSNIFVKNISNPQINDMVIFITDNSNKQEWSNQILSTFRFVDDPQKCLTVDDPCNPQACNFNPNQVCPL